MDFYIRKGSSEPILKLRLIDDGSSDKSNFNEKLENSTITFEMYDILNNNPVILNGEGELTYRISKFNDITDEYFIVYRFNEEETSKKGIYEGIFTIDFYDGSSVKTGRLILPIKEKLFINII